MKKIAKPHYSEHAVYYEQFIDVLNPEISVLQHLKVQAKEIELLLKEKSEEALLKPYLPEKWTVKQVVQHLMDMERVLMYRALCFSRLDKEPKYFFNENKFIENSIVNKIPIKRLLAEYKAQRASTIAFFKNQTVATLKRAGVASMTTMSVRACAWIIAGHELHHLKIIKEKYFI